MNNSITERTTINSLLSKESTKKRLEEVIGKEASSFTSAVLTIAKSPSLRDCTPESILGSAIICATLKLPINQNLGFAYIVPYKKEAQFQMGYKGFIQLAIRSGQFKKLNVSMLTKSQFKNYDELTGEIKYDLSDKSDLEPYVWVGYFQLINGFEKFFVMTKDELLAHARKYSKLFAGPYTTSSLWSTDFDNMARKTVIKLLLSKYAPLSLDMQTAQTYDQAVIDENYNIKYADNQPQELSKEVNQDADFKSFGDIGKVQQGE